MQLTKKDSIVIKFAGDSGDGMQLTGSQFTGTTALYGNDIGTFPDFPSEIRAPQGTVAGVSGYQVHFGNSEIYTPGDSYDVLVAMNAAAIKANLDRLKKGGIVILNTAGFDSKNLKLAECEQNPLEDSMLEGFEVYKIDVSKLTKETLKDSGLAPKLISRSKNMFVLGLLYWMFNRDMEITINFLNNKFKKKPEIAESNIKVLKAGYHYGETAEIFNARYEVEPAEMSPGTYRGITGNQLTALALVSAGQKADLRVFYGSYPITPASDILHELSKHKNYNVITFQAEDEIAAVGAAIGASYGGSIGVTGSSGPGIALKAEAIGLAVMLELPLVVINVQRGGPSTGLPTKTEQADLFQALYGRNGESQVVVFAGQTPSDCFDITYLAVKTALEHMTPVFILSDAYLANGSEPWKIPDVNTFEPITVNFASAEENKDCLPYSRDENLVRPYAIPGTPGLEHRVGGLEKEHLTGNVSYNPANHQLMTKLRAEKIKKIADFLPEQTIDQGNESGKLLILGWGSTFGVIKIAVKQLIEEGFDVSHAHLRFLNPFPRNLEELLSKFDNVLIPEMNDGQLINIIRAKFLIDAKALNKIQGQPFAVHEIKEAALEILNQ